MRPDGSGRDGYIRNSARDYRGQCLPTMSKHPARPLSRGEWPGTLRAPPLQTNHFLATGGHTMSRPKIHVGGGMYVPKIRINPITGEASGHSAVSTRISCSARIEELAQPKRYHERARTARATRDRKDFSTAEPIEVPAVESSDATTQKPRKKRFGGKSTRKLKLGRPSSAPATRKKISTESTEQYEKTTEEVVAPVEEKVTEAKAEADKVDEAEVAATEVAEEVKTEGTPCYLLPHGGFFDGENCNPNIITHSRPRLQPPVKKGKGTVSNGNYLKRAAEEKDTAPQILPKDESVYNLIVETKQRAAGKPSGFRRPIRIR
eukprot:gene782-265_t